jgi:DNA polymerase I-like protein with 3'-5' exonuclease and polymerase domains
LKFDFKRAVAESSSHELILPIRHIRVDLSYADIINVLSILRANHTPVATDIEGRLDTMSCISFASSAVMAFTVPFFRKDGSSVWTVTEECNILRAVAGLLEDPTVPKILQNCLYDTFVLQYSYRICIRNIIDDTMLKHWSLYAELRKSLALQTSIYTKEPYYKHERLQETEQEEE